MFGSNFDANFGIPAFPLQGMDPQGGALGVNVTPGADPAAAGATALKLPDPMGQATAPGLPGAAQTTTGPAQSPLGQPSPLASGAPAPQPAPAPDAAPAAGVGSPFGKGAQ